MSYSPIDKEAQPIVSEAPSYYSKKFLAGAVAIAFVMGAAAATATASVPAVSTSTYLTSEPYGFIELTSTGAGGGFWNGITSSSDGTTLVAVNSLLSDDGGNIFRSTDSGRSFTEIVVDGEPKMWNGVTSSSDGATIAATVEGTSPSEIWSSTDSGTNWRSFMSSGLRWQGIASSSDGTKIVVVSTDLSNGRDHPFFRSTDSGANFIEIARNPGPLNGPQWTCIASSGDGSKLAAARGGSMAGNIWLSTDSGESWIEDTSIGQKQWRGITMSSDGVKLTAIVALTGTVFGTGEIWSSTNSGTSWRRDTAVGEEKSWGAITSSSDGIKLAATVSQSGTTGGNIWLSTDSSLTWTDTSVGPQRWVQGNSGITMSSDGTTTAAGVSFGNIWLSKST